MRPRITRSTAPAADPVVVDGAALSVMHSPTSRVVDGAAAQVEGASERAVVALLMRGTGAFTNVAGAVIAVRVQLTAA